MSENDYADAYRTLGVCPSDSWEHVQRTYRHLVQRWHPDRLRTDDVAPGEAEEATKALNLAFSLLSDHYREFGTLPPLATPNDRGIDAVPARDDTQEAETNRSEETTPETNSPIHAEMQPRSSGGSLLAAIAIILGAYLFYEWGPFQTPQGQQAPNRANSESHVVVKESDTVSRPLPPNFIRRGATASEVTAIQGTPSSVENNIWYYGQSRVYFEDGRVSGWLNHPENPLQVRPEERVQARAGQHFHIGSTKEEVRLIQGEPIAAHPDMWDYGISRVYFRDDRVTGWDESPLQPLRTEKKAARN